MLTLHARRFAVALCLLAAAGTCGHGARFDGLSEEEKALADGVDHWGLPFGDQLTRFKSHFAADTNAAFAVGVTHDLVKIHPNKFWFRGDVFLPGAGTNLTPGLIGCPGETLSFQVAVLPALGTTGGVFEVGIRTEETPEPWPEITVFRQVYLRTPRPPYPRMGGDRWPDPLVPEQQAEAGVVEPAAFWIDVALPSGLAAGPFNVSLEVKQERSGSHVTLTVPVAVVAGLDLDPKAFPLVAWFGAKSGKIALTDEQYLGLCELVLAHHCQPLERLGFDPADPAAFDRRIEFLRAHGQRVIQVQSPPPAKAKPDKIEAFNALYAHLRKKGWLSDVIAYSNADEPDLATFNDRNVPYLAYVRETYPGLRIFLASEIHDNIAEGCDIVLTDLSSIRYDPGKHAAMMTPELWHYYCHLPIRWQMRAPLVQAPNMQIDNPALEHRLAMWMSYRLGAHGVFIWAGNREWDKMGTIWQDGEIRVARPYSYPYGGTHNGNGNLVYPPREEGGPVLPSVRLKVLRSGVQDVALLRACKELCAEPGALPPGKVAELEKLLDPIPALFHHPHYFDSRPEALLQRREAILRVLAKE